MHDNQKQLQLQLHRSYISSYSQLTLFIDLIIIDSRMNILGLVDIASLVSLYETVIIW